MNWEAFGSIAEAIGVVLVLVSILYLAVQIRQNTVAIKGGSHHAVTDSFNAISALIAQDAGGGRLWRLGVEGLSNLTDDEQVSFGFLCLMYTRVFETIYYQKKVGTMEEQLHVAEEQTLCWALTQPGYREWWLTNPISFSEEYRAYVTNLIQQIDAETSVRPTSSE